MRTNQGLQYILIRHVAIYSISFSYIMPMHIQFLIL